MPRNWYTKFVRKSQRAQITRQERGLAVLIEELRRKDVELTACPTAVPFVDGAKERRRAHLEEKRRHKPECLGVAGTTAVTDPTQIRDHFTREAPYVEDHSHQEVPGF